MAKGEAGTAGTASAQHMAAKHRTTSIAILNLCFSVSFVISSMPPEALLKSVAVLLDRFILPRITLALTVKPVSKSERLLKVTYVGYCDYTDYINHDGCGH